MRRFFPGFCHYLEDNELICVMNILIDVVDNNLMTCIMAGATRSSLSSECYTVEYFNIHGFYHVIQNLVDRNEPNLDRFQGKYRRSDAENIGSVCFMVREKIGLQTDRRTDGQTRRIHIKASFFLSEKSAFKKM